MKVKKFSTYIAEGGQPSADFVAPKDSDKEVKGYQPRAKGEQDFANQHMVQKTDYYAVPGQDHIFNGSVKEAPHNPNNGEGVQKQGTSDVNQPTGGGDSKRTADKSQGDMKPVNPIKEGLEDNDENPANRQHLCAKNVVHEQYGEGICISEEHAEPDENGHVEWYDVMFKHGLERFVPVAEMKVTKAEAHMHASKKPKKMSEAFDLIEGKVMDGLKKIVDKKSAGSVKFENGKTLKVDMTTANAMLNLYKKINDKNKKSMEDKIEKSPEVFMKLMDVAFGGK